MNSYPLAGCVVLLLVCCAQSSRGSYLIGHTSYPLVEFDEEGHTSEYDEKAYVLALDYSAASPRVVGRCDGSWTMWDTETRQIVLSGEEEDDHSSSDPGTIRFAPDGHTFSMTSLYDIVTWDAHTGAELQRFNNYPNSPNALVFQPGNGSRIAVAETNVTTHPFTCGYVTIYDAGSGEIVARSIAHAGETTAIDWSPDGRWLASAQGMAIGSSEQHAIWIWDTANGHLSVARKLSPGPGPNANWSIVRFSPSQQFVAAAGWGKVQVWDFESGELLFRARNICGSCWARGMDFSPDSSKLAFNTDEFGKERLFIVEVPSGRAVSTIVNYGFELLYRPIVVAAGN